MKDMGKKNKGKALLKKSVGVDGSDDEDSTVGESLEDGMLTPTRPKGAQSSHFVVSGSVEKLSEKRATAREKGWEQLIGHFRSSYENSSDLSIEGYSESILVPLLRAIRRPASLKEATLCTDLICLLSLYLGPDEEEFLGQVEKPLRHLVKGGHSNLLGISGPALSSLSFAAFISGNVDTGYRVWEYCARLLRDDGVLGTDDRAGSDDDDESDSDTSDANSSIEIDKDKQAIR